MLTQSQTLFFDFLPCGFHNLNIIHLKNQPDGVLGLHAEVLHVPRLGVHLDPYFHSVNSKAQKTHIEPVFNP